jgi:hypothetical protein
MVPVALGYAILRVDDTATVYMPAAKAASVRE